MIDLYEQRKIPVHFLIRESYFFLSLSSVMSLYHPHSILSIAWNPGLFSLFLLSISSVVFVSALREMSRTPIISALFCQRSCSSGGNRKFWKTGKKDY